MNHHNLVVLQRQIMAVTLEVSRLHEEASQNALFDIGEEVGRLERHARERQLLPRGHANQLVANIVGLLQRAETEIVLPAPVGIHLF